MPRTKLQMMQMEKNVLGDVIGPGRLVPGMAIV